MEIPLIEINANSNATESLLKVKNCISTLFPFNETLDSSSEVVKGGYGNSISTLRYTLNNKGTNLTILTHIASHLSSTDKYTISNDIENRMSSKGVLFLRFSKHELARKKISLTTLSDCVRVQIKISNNNHKLDIKKNLIELQEFLSGIGLIES